MKPRHACFNEAGADCPGMLVWSSPAARAQSTSASMRPGQTAPECARRGGQHQRAAACFNEAGADCPGMPPRRPPRLRSLRSFNEAGADCPGMPGELSAGEIGVSGFNEAGADCPGMPEYFRHGALLTYWLQ